MAEFQVSRTVAVLPLSLYVLAMGFGPVLGGPLSETLGRYPVYVAMLPLGTLFTLGSGLTHNFKALCFLRFMAGFTWGPIMAIGPGSINDTYLPEFRGPASALYILMPFLGPGFGPVIGSFVVNRKGWRWTQWTLIFMAIVTIILIPLGAETFHPVLKRRLAKKRDQPIPPQPSLSIKVRTFVQVALIRPIMMLLAEPIVTFLSLYVAVNFEHRLYAAMIGSFGPPIGLFWFAWTARTNIYWASPVAAIIPFAWGNLCIFISGVSYMVDTYSGDVVASGAAANSLARYGLAAAFPLFTIQMFEKLGIQWAGSLLGFLSVGLLPIPWVLFKFGPSIRALSRYETASYD
ncbi:hypothetical protein NQ176_g5509 [Zarea fungicola]|uniref:Uncharacterized protein n=1 Tax=Zarea fungicola TaxID=93591 RepID=A0ACC1N959_9HYPO|nr:hypothetical protein NQ176_g5509 [Lecanicillium fungicola]